MSELVKRKPGRPSKVRLEAEAEAERRQREAQNAVFDVTVDRKFLEGLPTETMPFATITRTYHGYNVISGKLTMRQGAPHCPRCDVSLEATVGDMRVGRPESRWVAEARLRTELSLQRNWLAQQPRPPAPAARKPWIEIGGDKLFESQKRIDAAVREIVEEDLVSPYLTEIPTRGKVTQ